MEVPLEAVVEVRPVAAAEDATLRILPELRIPPERRTRAVPQEEAQALTAAVTPPAPFTRFRWEPPTHTSLRSFNRLTTRRAGRSFTAARRRPVRRSLMAAPS